MQNNPNNPNNPVEDPNRRPENPDRGPGEHDQNEPDIQPEVEPDRDYPAPNKPIEPEQPPMQLKRMKQLIAIGFLPLSLLLGGAAMAASTTTSTDKNTEDYKNGSSEETKMQYEKALKDCDDLKGDLKEKCAKDAKVTHDKATATNTDADTNTNTSPDAKAPSENEISEESGKDAFEQASGMERDQPTGPDPDPEMKQQQPYPASSEIEKEVAEGKQKDKDQKDDSSKNREDVEKELKEGIPPAPIK